MNHLVSQRREVGEFRKRYKWMALFVAGTFGLLVIRVFYLQVLDYDRYAAIAMGNITDDVTLPATRGIIRDSGGLVVATNSPSYDVYVTPFLFSETEDLPRLAELLALSPAETEALTTRLRGIPEARRNQHIEAVRGIDRDQLAALEMHHDEFIADSGVAYVGVVTTPARTYPYATLGAHAIGYLNEVSAEDLTRLAGQGYRERDRIGREGIEAAWESYLRGQDGFQQTPVDSEGLHWDAPVVGAFRGRPAVPGRDLVITLDMELMRTIDRAFRGHPSGAVVVVEVNTGRVRALYSKPSYDLNERSGRLTSARFGELQNDPFRPLNDKTIYETYFPGSTFKPITALAALSTEGLNPSQRFDCPGFYEVGNRRFRCTAAHGDVDLRESLVQSCNVYFWKTAEQVGLERLDSFARSFGLGERTGIGINSEARGFLASREWYERQGSRFMIGFTMNTALGQGNTRATLLQLALAYAALANGGTLYYPQLVERIEEPNGDVIQTFSPRVRSQIDIPAEHLAYVNDGLYGVMNDPVGTAYEARIEGGIPVAGKTGTAQVERRRNADEPAEQAWYFNRAHAWFAGFAPAGDPQVAIVVLVEHGGGGGRYAAPIGTQILQEYLGGRAEERTAARPADARTGETRTDPRRGRTRAVHEPRETPEGG
jgi:penicillin-binding protein 2